MRTALLFTAFFLLGSFSTNAGTYHPLSVNAFCLACDVPSGLTASDITGTSATLTWNAMPGATQYDVEIQDEQNTPSNFLVETTVSGTTYTVNGLQAGVSYKFKVRTRCGSDKSDWSEWVFFTAGNNGGGGTCAVPTGLAASVTGNSVTLTWDAVNGAVKYIIEVEDEQNTPSVFHLEDSSATNTYTLSGLQAGVLYKFKVRSRCASGQSDWSNWVFFNGGTPGGGSDTVCLIPSILNANVYGTSATLSWNKVSGATQYYLEVEDEQNVPSNFHLETSTQDTFYVITGLQTGVLYKYKVSTHCGNSQSNWSGWLFFNGNTNNQSSGTSGACTIPTGLTVTNVTHNSAVLGWNPVPGVTSYTLEIERNHQDTTSWQITQVVTTNSFLLIGLSADTRYKFKVRSNCTDSTHSSWSLRRKFKTANVIVAKNNSSGNPDDTVASRSESTSADAELTLEVEVWPNPAQSTTTVHLQNMSAESATLRLFDLAGAVVQEQIIQPEGGVWEGTMMLGNLPSGLYLMQVSDGQQAQTLKLMVSR